MSNIDILSKEGNPAAQGIIISAIVIFAGIFPNISVGPVNLFIPIDSWLLILAGFASLFYFISMKINQSEWIDDKGNVWVRVPVIRSKLSQENFVIAVIGFIFLLVRIVYLVIIEVLK